MSAVIRLGYVNLRVTDLEEARNHYSNTLGMEVVHMELSTTSVCEDTGATVIATTAARPGAAAARA
jgi:catechol-2,3-dioxygenase